MPGEGAVDEAAAEPERPPKERAMEEGVAEERPMEEAPAKPERQVDREARPEEEGVVEERVVETTAEEERVVERPRGTVPERPPAIPTAVEIRVVETAAELGVAVVDVLVLVVVARHHDVILGVAFVGAPLVGALVVVAVARVPVVVVAVLDRGTVEVLLGEHGPDDAYARRERLGGQRLSLLFVARLRFVTRLVVDRAAVVAVGGAGKLRVAAREQHRAGG